MERPEPLTDLDWSPDRAAEFGQATLELWTEYLRRLPELPVTHPHTPAETRAGVLDGREIPEKPLTDDELLDHLRTVVMDYGTQTGHGGFMAYITGAGTVPGAPAALLAAGINQNLGGWPLSPAATEIENHVLAWFADRLGLPPQTSGAFVTGGATANLMALAVARDSLCGWDVRRDGVSAGPPLAVYASDDVHETVDRAADLLGLGTAAVRRLPTDDRFRLRASAVEAAIQRDLADGVKPLAVVATAGTTEMGAIDPLSELADVAERYGCWFHVDAAYGGPAAMVDELRPRFAGISRADSITCDPHKWMNIPVSASLVLFRDPARQVAAFTLQPDYAKLDATVLNDMVLRFQWTPQFTRPFDALPVWVSLLAQGWDPTARRIRHDAELASWLHHLVSAHDELQALADPELSIVCFRYVPPGGDELDPAYLDDLNERILYAVQRAGKVYPSNAVIRGRYAIRACLISYRTEASHVETLVDEVVAHGRRLHAEGSGDSATPRG